jgi:hypothetical protein
MSYSPADIVVGFNITGTYISETTDDPVSARFQRAFPFGQIGQPFDGW